MTDASITLIFALCLGASLVLLAFARRASRAPVVGFFHPYCHAGGGGERVLWCAIAALHARACAAGVSLRVVVFTGDAGVAPSTIVARAAELFGVALPVSAAADGGAAPGARLEFVYIRSRALLEARLYPRLTLLGQSFGSMLCALECLLRTRVDVWVDTTGAAFTFPLARLAGARVAAYVHYPTVSTDMLDAVATRAPAFNNAPAIARSRFLTAAKLAYYRAFAAAYGAAGRCAATGGVMANSSWTAGHVRSIWGCGADIVYPPCPCEDLASLPLPTLDSPRARLVISIAQFRPEKDHALQLRAFAAFRDANPRAHSDVRLCLMGGARDSADLARVAALKALATELGLMSPASRASPAVEFVINAPYSDVRSRLGSATAGLHTMRAEHFGIGIVEMQAAGCVAIAHDSGGPRSDIVIPPWQPNNGGGGEEGGVGLLASTIEGYAAALSAVFDGRVNVPALTARARASCARFSDGAFASAFVDHVWPLIPFGTALWPQLPPRAGPRPRRRASASR